MEIEIRKASHDDINDFYYWRNHKKTRNMLKNSEPISWKEHTNWYLKSLKRINRVSLVILLKESKLKIGCIGFDIKENNSFISIIIDPKFRKKKLSKISLDQAIKFFKKDNSNIDLILAEIKSENIASEKIFEQVGFVLKKKHKNINIYELSIP
jgi:UDP-2,4-diacetamido-2,4,6-trideoxy-beta-L-altropyranose hydrolase